MKRCDSGHYYDEKKHSLCPHCGVNIDFNFDATVAKNKQKRDQLEKTVAKNIPLSAKNNDEKTVAIVRKETGLDPVVGWLVCVEGVNRGRDYRIRSERNFIGRSEQMDICIHGDEAISRENHAIVSYNPKKHQFRVYPGESRGLVYLNDEEVVVSELLNPYDIIELGQTKLVFIPLCGESFNWK